MNYGECLTLTTLSGMGVDIQALGKESKSFFPPHHLNFLNPKSLAKLLLLTGFKEAYVTTPGKLDVDILSNNKKKIQDRFWKNFIDYSNESEKVLMQEFLQKSGLSSHMMSVSIR